MNDDMMMREQLSALADGELQGEEFAHALTYAANAEGRATWQLYHLIGDTLRSSEAAGMGDLELVDRLRTQLARANRRPFGGRGSRSRGLYEGGADERQRSQRRSVPLEGGRQGSRRLPQSRLLDGVFIWAPKVTAARQARSWRRPSQP